MMIRKDVMLVATLLFGGTVSALEPHEILVIANRNISESGQIARTYCQKRGVPLENILELPLGTSFRDTISRDDYEKQFAEPIREEFLKHEHLGKIKCLLTLYGVPFKHFSPKTTEAMPEVPSSKPSFSLHEGKAIQKEAKDFIKAPPKNAIFKQRSNS